MAIWRPVSGSIIRLDPSLASIEQIEDFFAERRIVARGAEADGDDYAVELAVTGRRRRVAMLGEDGDVVPGPSLSELVEDLDDTVRKLQIDIGGLVAWGAIDLGEVDVEGDDVDPARSDADSHQLDGSPVDGSPGADDSADDEVEGDLPDFGDGPLLVLSDVSFGALPGAAASLNTELAALRIEGLTAVVAEAKPSRSNAPGASADVAIVLSVDAAGLDAPILTVRSDGVRVTWTWSDELENLPWFADEPAALSFAAEELGAGAFVSRIARFLPVDPDAVRAALTGDPDAAPGLLVEAFGLPSEVADCLRGLLVPRAIPGTVIFEPKPFAARLQSSVAHAVAGQGASEATLVRAYRKVYLEHPRVTEIVASVQASIGALVFVGGLRAWRRPRGKVLSILGGALAINAVTRILTTQWIQAALRVEGLSVRADDEPGDDADAEPADGGASPDVGHEEPREKSRPEGER